MDEVRLWTEDGCSPFIRFTNLCEAEYEELYLNSCFSNDSISKKKKPPPPPKPVAFKFWVGKRDSHKKTPDHRCKPPENL